MPYSLALKPLSSPHGIFGTCLLHLNLQLPYTSPVGSLHSIWKPRDPSGCWCGALSVRTLHVTIASPFCCGHLLLMLVRPQSRLLYLEPGRDAGNELLSSSLNLPPSLAPRPFFPLPRAEETRGEEKRRHRSLVLIFIPLFPLPPAPDQRWKGRPLPLPAGWQVAAFPSMSPSFPLCGLPCALPLFPGEWAAGNTIIRK